MCAMSGVLTLPESLNKGKSEQFTQQNLLINQKTRFE